MRISGNLHGASEFWRYGAQNVLMPFLGYRFNAASRASDLWAANRRNETRF